MTSYRKMYETLLSAQMKAIEILQEGQQAAKQIKMDCQEADALILAYHRQSRYDCEAE